MQFNIYIGYDTRNYGQQLAFEICKRSIMNSTKHQDKIGIMGLNKNDLENAGLFYRENDDMASTEFTYTRFLSPALNKFTGLCVFCDSDFLWECDIYEEFRPYFEEILAKNLAISCVKHNYVPDHNVKMDGRIQTVYPKKNWSSLILFNCDHPEVHNLSVENVNKKDPAWLHRMQWCSEDNIGNLPHTYNYLVGTYHDNNEPKAIHYTDGGPWHYFLHPKTKEQIVIKDVIADAFLQQILLRPKEYSVIATLNLNGDYISDALAAQVGGIGIAPGANMGDVVAVFEATHGTAPKYAGQDKVNPGSLILSAEMMLRHMGWIEAADLIIHGMSRAIKDKKVTYDFARLMPGATEVSCSQFGEHIITKMQ